MMGYTSISLYVISKMLGGDLALNFNPFELPETTPSSTPLLQWQGEERAICSGAAVSIRLHSLGKRLEFAILNESIF
jgi:hypothetical protein